MPLFDLLVPTNEAIIDLPLQLTEDGVVSELPCKDMKAVSERTVLEVVESALPPETLAKYCAAYISGTNINDALYATWKMYKSKCANKTVTPEVVMNTHFPLPKKAKTTTKRKIENSKYFVISADEVYRQKVQKDEEKKQKMFEKEIRKIEREQKKQLKQMHKKAKKDKLVKPN